MPSKLACVFSVLLLTSVTFAQDAAKASEDALPPEAQREKARLEFLFNEVSKRYPCEIKTEGDPATARIYSITWAQDLGPVNGEMRIPVPPDMVRVWKLFDELRFYGSGLGQPGQEISFLTPYGERHFGFWRHKDVMLAGHSNRMRPTDDTYEGYTIVVKGQGRIDRVVLRSHHGVSAKFDDTPWSTLGKDKPIKRVSITVDATHRRAIAGSVRLEREKFWRIASHNGNHPDGLAAAAYAAKRGFLPGRDIWKLAPLTKWGYGGIKLREDPDHPGRPDYRPFRALKFDAKAAAERRAAFPRNYKHVTCFDDWPEFMALKGTRAKNIHGTPADFYEAAKLAAAAIGWQKIVRGECDTYWEVKNESTIINEWVLHAEEGVDSWGELAKFHNIMADTIHAAHPDVLVGGPASAWMRLDHNNFELARKQLRFMDQTKGHLDFYSHHFYEGRELILSEGEAFSGGYLMGRLEGCLDLLRNHMELTDNVRPLIISETGTLADLDTEMNIWLNIKNLSSYLIRYINYPDKIDLINLWLIPYPWWDKQSRGLFFKDESGKLVLRKKVGYFLELWKDYRGDRLPNTLNTPDTNVHLHSVIDGRTVWIAINNLNPYRIAVDVSLLTGEAKPEHIEQMRLYFDKGKIHFETVEHASLKELPLAVEETSLVKITLDRAPTSRGTLNERTFYGDKYLQPTGKPVDFTVASPVGNVAKASLRICLSKDGGFSQKLSVYVNGKCVARNRVITPQKKTGNYWGYLNVDVPAELIRKSNVVTVTVPEKGGYITSVALIVATLK